MSTRQLLFCSACLTAVMLVGMVTEAAVILGVAVDPPTTAGGGATSTRSGSGTWQLYALDTDPASLGISSYNVTMSNTTAINHRAPITVINDHNGDPQTAGFNLLRTATNVNPIQASQNLPGQTPFMITGFGKTAGNFAAKAAAIDPGSAIAGPTTSGSWGAYSLLANSSSSSYGFGAWVFLAEGAWNQTGGGLPTASGSVATVFSNPSFVSVAAQTQAVLLTDPTIYINNVNATDPGAVTFDLSSHYPGPPPSQFQFLSYRSPTGELSSPALAYPATIDPITKQFRWNTTGAMLGEYSWHTANLDSGGNYNRHFDITVRITAVPEPATLTTLAFAIASTLMFRRNATTSRCS